MRVGILGGGQLGRMLALAGHALGVETRVFDPDPEASAGRVTAQVCAPFTDEAALADFARQVDVVTFEREHLPLDAVQSVARHAPLRPGARALAITQDRLAEKDFVRSLGHEVAPYRGATGAPEVAAALRALGLPAIVKHRRHGYDGRGQRLVRDQREVHDVCAEAGDTPVVVERVIPFQRELSIVAVRDPDGRVRHYPLVENSHAGGILRRSLAPAPGLTATRQREAEAIAEDVLAALDYIGVLTIELFEHDGRLLVNELAPRVHNSGHWTIEGAVTSQFENHLRAVLGLPLGVTAARGPTGLVNLIGSVPTAARVLAVPGAHLHLYGKRPQPGRKLGHVTVELGGADSPSAQLARFEDAIGVDEPPVPVCSSTPPES